jgi:hypothetical protein
LNVQKDNDDQNWTADRLQKRGLPHSEHRPLCDQDDEIAQHILTSCISARQFWFSMLQPLHLAHLVPTSRSSSFVDCWKKAEKKVQRHHRRGFNSSCIMGAWILWKHRNACAFDGVAPNLRTSIQNIEDESYL